jgi:predicted phosphodiesterase
MRTIVLGDAHLTRHTPAPVVGDLCALVRAHAGGRVVVAGDLFDLSAVLPQPTIDEVLGRHPTLRATLGEHVTRGGELWLAAGNHDAELVERGGVALAEALALDAGARARVRTTPWFFRDGDLHVEHGHLYDPDNAPEHPLVRGQASLGVHFVREFIAPTGAYAYLNENDETPLDLFVRAFTRYGLRGPYVVYRFFHAAATALAKSGPLYAARGESAEGRARLEAFAAAAGAEPGATRRLADAAPRPTLESLRATFARLYLDRVAATIAMGSGAALFASGRAHAGAVALGAGALVMAASWMAGHDRHRGTVVERLAHGARLVREATGASVVVFGHTHRESCADGYANTGSFAFSRGTHRPYLEIEGAPGAARAVPRGWPKTA